MSDIRYVVFDIETSNTFQEVGSSDPAKLDIALVGVYDSGTDSYDSFLQDDFPRLWSLLEQIDMIIGFNSEHFDLPLLNKYYPGDLAKIPHLDLLTKVQEVLGHRLRLQSLAEGTLKAKKGGSGLESITWWKNGEVEKVRKYCLKDVELTKKIFDYARTNGALKYNDFGRTREFKIDTSSWLKKNEETMTHTLPW
jgi:DEAD/DEAH box helicase domain-containing protein